MGKTCIRNHHLTSLRDLWIVLGTCFLIYTSTILNLICHGFLWSSQILGKSSKKVIFRKIRPLQNDKKCLIYLLIIHKKWLSSWHICHHFSTKNIFVFNVYLGLWRILVCQKTNIINDVYAPKKTFLQLWLWLLTI